MAGRWRHRLQRSLAVGCCAVVAACATGGTHRAESPPPAALRVLQMNLCDSGIAGCYTGRSLAEAAALIRSERPDIVTLNEVCRSDVSALQRAMSAAEGRGTVVPAFEAAVARLAGGAVRCRNGQQYGIGVLARVPAPGRGYTTDAGRYPAQDSASPEERVWLCINAAPDFHACTTHLASADPAVAISQCRYLMDTAIPALRTHEHTVPVIVGGDFNLNEARSPNTRSCLPPGFEATDDGGTQDIVVSAAHALIGRSISMRGTTDHPALLAEIG